MIRHDRSVIDTYGGVWPGVADKVHDEAVVIADQPESTERAFRSGLRDRRKAAGFAQATLAAVIGCSAVTISNLENGVTRESVWIAKVEAALAAAEAEKRT